MTGGALFLSDVHLNPGDPERQKRFISFLAGRRDRARLFLLGDVFDYWIGPKHLRLDDYRIALEGLRDLTRNGTQVSFIPGNRDYLVDEAFSQATGVRLMGEEAEVSLGGRRLYLAHGDFIYNRNPKYNAYRRMMRFRALRAAFLSIPAALERVLAKGLRRVSVATTPAAAWTQEDLLAGAEKFFQRGADVVICGHIHAPCHISENGRDLFVLGDWGAAGEYVEFDGSAFTLRRAL